MKFFFGKKNKFIFLHLTILFLSSYSIFSIASPYDGVWTGKIISGVGKFTCTYQVNFTINAENASVHWVANRTDCSHYISCHSCDERKDIKNSLVMNNDGSISFSIEKNDTDKEYWITLNLDKDQKNLSGSGNIKKDNAFYNVTLSKSKDA